MTGNNYFSWDNIGEMADIDAHITYASTLMGKYKWEASTKTNLEKQMCAIVEKQKDKLLNISVIGEFTTGKSSFINALVGYELLAVNILQGTTVAITIIEYSENFTMTLTDFAGNITPKEYPSIDVLRRDLLLYTTDPTYAKGISYVKVTLPSDILKSGYRIIDTPGTNSLELWHEDVTRRALRDISDLSIVLVDATKPMPETLVMFIDDALGSAVKDCAFVVNKIDLIREREREGIIKYTGIKLNQNFEMEEPFVLPFAAVALTNTFASEKVEVDSQSFMLTTQSMKKLLSYTARQRMKAQARKVLHLIDGIYSTLEGDMKKMGEGYEKELKMLERSKQMDLKPFISAQIVERQKSFLSSSRDLRQKMGNGLDVMVTDAHAHINAKVDAFVSIKALSDYLKGGGAASDIAEEGKSITQGTSSFYLSCMQELFKTELKTFQKAFKQEFERLKILSVKFDVKQDSSVAIRSANSASIAPVTKDVEAELSKENWAIGGGLAIGAAIGTAIFPGVGTFVGGIIGGIFGAGKAPNISDVKAKAKAKMLIPMNSYFQSVANDCLACYDRYKNATNEQLKNEIIRYESSYSEKVQQRIDKWNLQHKTVKEKIGQVKAELNNIGTRKQSIQRIITKL